MTYKSRPISVINEEDYMCGIGSWRPRWAQRFGSPKVFLFVFSVIGILQGAVFTYMVGSITTIEKRYAFGSKVTGLILIADNFVSLISSPVFGYLANRVHRPRMIAFSELIVALGCFLTAIPYFIYGPALHLLGQQLSTNQTLEYCDSNRLIDSECLDGESNTVIFAVVILWIASCCNGIGSTAFYIVGVPFIDDSVKKKNSPLYISIVSALRLCGPTLGFMLSSFCLRYYENPLIDSGITNRKDPRWVGAWWIGFVILGTGVAICSLPMFLFPRQFKPSATKPKPLINEVKKVEDNREPNIFKRLVNLAKNPIYVCYVIGTTSRLFALLGYLTFKSKYIESQYKKSASSANFFSGLVGIIPSAIGIFLGGYLIRQFQPGPKLLTSIITLVEILGTIGLIAAFFLGCPASQFAGTPTDSHFEMQNMCNDNCYCTEKVLQPICATDTQTNYFSPCFAGCKPDSVIKNQNKPDQYSNCDCFTGQATQGYCDNNCNNFGIYVGLLGVSNIIGNIAKTGNSIISFRIVDQIEKSFAIGVMGTIMNIFAFIPYPLVYGAVTDSACLVWETKCGQRGNCWIYDSTKFRNYLHGLTLSLLFFGSIFDVIVVILSSRIKNLYNDEIESNEKSVVTFKLRSNFKRKSHN